MQGRKALPQPVTVTDMYLSAIVSELRGLHDLLAAGRPAPPAAAPEFELREPARKPRKGATEG